VGKAIEGGRCRLLRAGSMTSRPLRLPSVVSRHPLQKRVQHPRQDLKTTKSASAESRRQLHSQNLAVEPELADASLPRSR